MRLCECLSDTGNLQLEDLSLSRVFLCSIPLSLFFISLSLLYPSLSFISVSLSLASVSLSRISLLLKSLSLFHFNVRANIFFHFPSATQNDRKMDPSTLNPVEREELEHKRERRMIKNRESASLSRKRKKEYMDNLEARVRYTAHENQMLQKQVSGLGWKTHAMRRGGEATKQLRGWVGGCERVWCERV